MFRGFSFAAEAFEVPVHRGGGAAASIQPLLEGVDLLVVAVKVVVVEGVVVMV